MKRTLIAQGKGGLTIYLPKNWLDAKGLKAGEEVEVEELNTELLVKSSIKTSRVIELVITKENEHDVLTLLTHAYRKGYDLIKVKSTSSALPIEQLKEAKDKMLGFEITEKTSHQCTLENISEPTEQKYNALVRRILLIIRESLIQLKEDYGKHSYKLEEFKSLREEQDRFILFCKRTLVKEKYEHDPLVEWEFLTFLTHIQHTIYYAYEYLSKNKVKSNKENIELLNELVKYYELIEKAWSEKNVFNIHKINAEKNKYQFGKCINLLEKSKDSQTVLISYIRELFRLIQISTSPLLAQQLKERYENQ